MKTIGVFLVSGLIVTLLLLFGRQAKEASHESTGGPVAFGMIEGERKGGEEPRRTLTVQEGEASPALGAVAQGMAQAPSLEQLHSLYRGQGQRDLELALAQSKKKVEALDLIEKANREELSVEEATALTKELRLQAVLSLELTQARLAAIEERYQ